MAGKENKIEVGQPDSIDPDNTEDVEEPEPVGAKQESSPARVLRLSVSLRTLVAATLIAALLASSGVLGWLYLGAQAKLDDEARQAENYSNAERVALDYAVLAAEINIQDLATWKSNLVKGTSPELKDKLDKAATAMDQLLVPLEWNSTADPLAAKVRSSTNGIYVVDAFVNVVTKTTQAPEGLQSTATYSVTLDSNHDWQITDVGGIGAVVGAK